MARDFFNTEIEPRDVIAYPVRQGSSMYLRAGVVVEIDPGISTRDRWNETTRRFEQVETEAPVLKVLTTSSTWDTAEGEYVDSTRIVTLRRLDNVVRVPKTTGAKLGEVEELLAVYDADYAGGQSTEGRSTGEGMSVEAAYGNAAADEGTEDATDTDEQAQDDE